MDEDMSATAQAALWPDLYVDDEASGVRDTLRDRWRALTSFAQEHGGLAPQSACAELLGVSQPRISQLVKAGQLCQVKFLGVTWITGNSLSLYLSREEKSVGGRGIRNPRLWDEIVISGKVIAANLAAVTPDRWVE